ncbi:VanZ family protein [Bacillus sp. 165]|uniref:VanZ family protein n=1 Tax=Bacillus sp. 165 TaxID=1529117 RepID=UPI001ADD2E23|nr:VanZ family protein [Bacillus sp. 165]MBO9129984.1 VanZ family protein [Bacillus sp. 165]
MKKLLWFWLPVLLWAGMIFYSSSQPYGKQDMRSTITQYIDESTVEHLFSWVHFTYGESEVSVEARGASGFLEFFLRKGAHFTVFFVLGVLICRALRGYGTERRKVFLFALLLTAGYASFDELHQSFTADRTPMWQDSVLDTCGGFIGITMWTLLTGKKRRGLLYKIKDK